MKYNTSILLYEKDKILNSILIKQLSYLEDYKLHLVYNKNFLFNVILNKEFDVCILNLKDLKDDIYNFIEIFQSYNNHTNIIIYNQNKEVHSIALNSSIIYLKTPFKVRVLFNYLKIFEDHKKTDNSENLEIYLMKELVFLPLQKLVLNKRTKKNQHLTEKENSLLLYLFKNQNLEISKKNYLIQFGILTKI